MGLDREAELRYRQSGPQKRKWRVEGAILRESAPQGQGRAEEDGQRPSDEQGEVVVGPVDDGAQSHGAGEKRTHGGQNQCGEVRPRRSNKPPRCIGNRQGRNHIGDAIGFGLPAVEQSDGPQSQERT